VRGAIAQTAEAVYGALPEAEQRSARDLFVRLTELGEGTEDTRRRVNFEEVVPAGPAGEQARAVITRLADARLLTTSAETVEVAHEALIREWPRLRDWLDEDREGLRLMRHVTESAQSWERSGRDPDELYRGARLSAAFEWSERAKSDLNPLERSFLDASREFHEREVRDAHARMRRLRLLAVAATTLAVVALVVGALAALQWSRANDQRDTAQALRRDADTRRLVAESGKVQSNDLSLSLLLAREANARSDDTTTRSALQSALLSNGPILGYLRASPTAHYAWLAPGADGHRLYLAREENVSKVIEVWDPQTSRQIDEITAPGVIESLIVSPSHRRVAVFLNESDTTMIVDTESDAILATVELPSTGAPAREAFLDDERLLSFRDRQLLVYDLATNQLETPYTAPEGGFRVAVVDATTWSTVAELPVPRPGTVFYRIEPSADGRRIAVSVSGGANEQGVLLDIASGQPVGSAWPEQSALPAALPDGGFLVGSIAGELRRRSADGDQLGSAVKLYNGATYNIAVEGDTAYVLGPAGVAVVSTPLIDGVDGRSKLGRPLTGLPRAVPGPGGIVAAHRDSDGMVVVSSLDRDGDPIVLQPTAAAPSEGVGMRVAISADGRWIAAAGWSGVLSVFDASSLRLVRSIPYATNRSIDSKFTAGAGDAAGRYAIPYWVSPTTALLGTWDAVVSIDLETGQKRWEARGFRDVVTAVSVSTDETLVVASDFCGTARLLRFDDGTQVGAPLANGSMTPTERGTDPITHASEASFLSDSHVAALDDWESGAIRFVDVDSRTQPAPPLAVTGGLPDFSADGRLVAVGSTEGAVRLYDIEAGAQIGDPFPSTGTFDYGFITADGRAVVAAGDPSIVWDIAPASWRDKACNVAGRNLTKLEWRQHMPSDEPYRATCPSYPIES
jgi:WD40 repeat protein